MRLGISVVLTCVLASPLSGEEMDEARDRTVRSINLDAIGGMALTPLAMIAGRPPSPEHLGRPVVSALGAAGHDKSFGAFHVSWPIGERVEVGFSHQTLHLGSLRKRVRETVALDLGTHHLTVETFSAKYILVPQGGEALPWMPAIAAGAHYKYNPDIAAMNRKLMHALSWLGIDDDDGVDFTLTATRVIRDVLPTPLVVSAGVRFSEANQTGFAGFSDGYRATFEGSVAWWLSEQFMMGAEYRQKPDRLRRFGSLYRAEDDWYTVFAAYEIDDHSSVAVGWANVGRVANSREPAMLGVSFTYTF